MRINFSLSPRKLHFCHFNIGNIVASVVRERSRRQLSYAGRVSSKTVYLFNFSEFSPRNVQTNTTSTFSALRRGIFISVDSVFWALHRFVSGDARWRDYRYFAVNISLHFKSHRYNIHILRVFYLKKNAISCPRIIYPSHPVIRFDVPF